MKNYKYMFTYSFSSTFRENRIRFNGLEQKFNEFLFRNIPKILNLYWGLNSKLSYLHYLTVYSFNKLHPEWKINLYVPKYPSKSVYSDKIKKEHILYSGTDYFNELIKIKNLNIIEVDFKDFGFLNDTSEVFKSDFLRYYILYKEGGIWSDFDILYFKPVYSCQLKGYLIVGNHLNFDTAIIYRDLGYHQIGFFISSKSNSYFEYLHKQAYRFFNEFDYQSIGANMINYLFPNFKSIKRIFKNLNIIDLRAYIVFPFLTNYLGKLYYETKYNWLREETIGIHWYYGHPLSKIFLEQLDKNRNNLPKSTILTLIEYIENL